MAQTRRQRIGQWGEGLAADYLERQGYQVVERNFHTRFGEIDLIARLPDGGLVFVEVKTRTNLAYGFPEESVDARKLEHTKSAALVYLLDHPEESEVGWRIDVVSIHGHPGGKAEDTQIEHFEDVAT